MRSAIFAPFTLASLMLVAPALATEKESVDKNLKMQVQICDLSNKMNILYLKQFVPHTVPAEAVKQIITLFLKESEKIGNIFNQAVYSKNDAQKIWEMVNQRIAEIASNNKTDIGNILRDIPNHASPDKDYDVGKIEIDKIRVIPNGCMNAHVLESLS